MRTPATVGAADDGALRLACRARSKTRSRAAAPHQQNQQRRQHDADDDGAEAAEPVREKEEHLAVAFVALPALHLRLGLLAAIGGQRFADVIGFLELATSAAPDEPLIRAGVDQFRFAAFFLPAGLLLPPVFLPPSSPCRLRRSCAIRMPPQHESGNDTEDNAPARPSSRGGIAAIDHMRREDSGESCVQSRRR